MLFMSAINFCDFSVNFYEVLQSYSSPAGKNCLSATRVQLFDCRMENDGYSVVNVVAPGFSGALRYAWVVTRCSCVFVLVDLVDHFANFASSTTRGNLGSSSCIPLSQRKPQAVCCGRRL